MKEDTVLEGVLRACMRAHTRVHTFRSIETAVVAKAQIGMFWER